MMYQNDADRAIAFPVQRWAAGMRCCLCAPAGMPWVLKACAAQCCTRSAAVHAAALKR